MKYIIIIGDGMADDIKTCKNGTPLMVAKTPYIDMLALNGRCGELETIPSDMHPGSEIANLSILGYDPHQCYQGRGVLEAASLGIELDQNDVALRCNLICINDGKIKNHSAGHISSEEGKELIQFLNEKLGNENVKFYPGVSYRHILVLKNASTQVNTTPPHDVPGTDVESVMSKPNSDEGNQTSELINSLIRQSWELLAEHPINQKRKSEGKDPANSIWPWSAGKKPDMENFKEKYGKTGAVISAVDLIKGLGVYAGMDVVNVEGATGLNDTNYEGKAMATIKTLETHDLVFVHIEAPDEAGHEGDFDLKVKCIENLDHRMIGTIIQNLESINDTVRIAVLPDHPTPVALRTHTRDSVPFIICDFDRLGKIDPEHADKVNRFNEICIIGGSLGFLQGEAFIKRVLLNV